MPDFRTRIAGIPCIVRYEITGCYEPETPVCPASHPDLEFEVCDRRGRTADWLFDKMTQFDEERICKECWQHDKNERVEAEKSAAENAAMWRQEDYERRMI